uniref:Uncharacterized protein n=1 Tax=Neolamprologus brichardi TaxID=32507 RepID=A0A3Q4HQC6_NEOBR
MPVLVPLCQHACKSAESENNVPELNPTEHLVTDITTLAVLRQTLVQEWDAIAQQCVTKVMTSMRRRCQAVGNVYDSSTCY